MFKDFTFSNYSWDSFFSPKKKSVQEEKLQEINNIINDQTTSKEEKYLNLAY